MAVKYIYETAVALEVYQGIFWVYESLLMKPETLLRFVVQSAASLPTNDMSFRVRPISFIFLRALLMKNISDVFLQEGYMGGQYKNGFEMN
jgi:hypothetical protein